METRDKFVMSVAFSPDNKYLASGGLDGLVNIFDVKVRTQSRGQPDKVGEDRTPRSPSNKKSNGWTKYSSRYTRTQKNRAPLSNVPILEVLPGMVTNYQCFADQICGGL